MISHLAQVHTEFGDLGRPRWSRTARSERVAEGSSCGSKRRRGSLYVRIGQLFTPRTNIGLQQQNGPFGTLWQALDYAARGRTGMNFYSSRGLLEHALPYGELRERAVSTVNRRSPPDFAVVIGWRWLPRRLRPSWRCSSAANMPAWCRPVPYSMSVGGKESYVERIAGMFAAPRFRQRSPLPSSSTI